MIKPAKLPSNSKLHQSISPYLAMKRYVENTMRASVNDYSSVDPASMAHLAGIQGEESMMSGIGGKGTGNKVKVPGLQLNFGLVANPNHVQSIRNS